MRLQWNTVHTRLFGRSPEEHRIGRYVVHGTLGQGGMGKVLRAYDETLGRDVALKVLHARGSSQEQRLLREAQALARLSHHNVVRVYDVAEIDGRVCMAMELVEGTPLQRWQCEPRPWPEALAVYLQAARGLQAAHTVGLVHRDFKPANCILDAQGTVKVLDFGLARGTGAGTGPHPAAELERTGEEEHGDGEEPSSVALRSQLVLEQALTRTGAVLGTLAYMAPEQLMGKPADPRSDQFAFCVALHEALYAERPFPGKSAYAIIHAMQSRSVDARPVPAGLPAVPRWLHEVLRRGLSLPSHQRWPDMASLLGALEHGLARQRRIRGVALGVLLVTGLGGGLVASGAFQGERPCDGLHEQAMPAWTEDDRRAVGEALETARTLEGASAREHVQAQLDAYAHAWTEARADACEATWVRREAGEQVLVRRMACLDDRVAHVRAVVEQLANADARTAGFASDAVEALPELGACGDVEALLRGPEPVPDELAHEAAEVRALVARSWALGATGNGEHGVEAADRAVAEAEALAEAPTLRLEALHNRGYLLRMIRRWPEARRDLEAALELAERLDDASRSIDVLTELVLLADDDKDVSAANAWLGAIRGKLGRLEDQPRRVAQRWWLEGRVALRARRNEDALAAAERAVRAYERLDPPSGREQVEALLLLGDAHRELRDLERAREAFERASALAEAGARLPLVAHALYRLAYLDFIQGRLESARPRLERAIVLRDEFYGPGAVASLRARVMLAEILRQLDEASLAIEQISLARQHLDEHVPDQLRGEVLELAGALHRARAQWDDAIRSYREARVAWQSLPNRAQLAMLDSNIADCLSAKGELDAARASYDDALALLEATAPGDPQRIHPLIGRGQAWMALGEHERAVSDLRVAAEIDQEHPSDPVLGAELRWALGRALRPAPGAGAAATREAAVLARAARQAFVEHRVTDRVQEIDAWLDRCGTACRM